MAQAQGMARQKYVETREPKRMLTHKLLSRAIRNDLRDVSRLLPARTSTSVEYKAGATRATAWDYRGTKVSISLPLADGWYVPDGNPFDIPNGCESSADDPNALYLVRAQDAAFRGGVGRSGSADRYRRCYLIDVHLWHGLAYGPKALVQIAQQLESEANRLTSRLGEVLDLRTHTRLIKPLLDEAAVLRELAGKI